MERVVRGGRRPLPTLSTHRRGRLLDPVPEAVPRLVITSRPGCIPADGYDVRFQDAPPWGVTVSGARTHRRGWFLRQVPDVLPRMVMMSGSRRSAAHGYDVRVRMYCRGWLLRQALEHTAQIITSGPDAPLRMVIT